MRDPSDDIAPGLTAEAAKAQAKRLRAELAGQGTALSHGQALEHVARLHGCRDWNTLYAALNQRPNRIVLRPGDRVQGRYLGQPFTGELTGLRDLGAKGRAEVTIRFDRPVDVVQFDSFSNFRHRIAATIGPDGCSARRTSDGQPQLVLERAG